jgi:pSer/pThr/pTyr-binding forkhead associated (FHA) protein
VLADIALPVSYDWFLLGTRVLIALILLGFLWRVMIIVGRESLLTSPSVPQVSLALLDDSDQPVRGFRLSRRKPLTIGREASNDIVLTDRSVSGHHAVIRLMQGEWVLVDLDSRNGTYVNGSAIAAETSISENDIVQFGAVRLQMVPNESTA